MACCHVAQFSSSRLPAADVFASYRNVKWRTPPRAKIAGKIDMSKIGKTNFFIKRDRRIGICNASRWLPDLVDGTLTASLTELLHLPQGTASNCSVIATFASDRASSTGSTLLGGTPPKCRAA